MSNSKTIYLRQGQSQRVQLERLASAALYPGHMVELLSTNKLRKHATAGGYVPLAMFALEDENQGNDINDAFAADDLVVAIIPQKGDFIQAILSNGESVVIGDKLESNGDGTLRKYVADTFDSDQNVTVVPSPVVAIAMEALDLSDSSGAETADAALGYDKRIWVMTV